MSTPPKLRRVQPFNLIDRQLMIVVSGYRVSLSVGRSVSQSVNHARHICIVLYVTNESEELIVDCLVRLWCRMNHTLLILCVCLCVWYR